MAAFHYDGRVAYPEADTRPMALCESDRAGEMNVGPALLVRCPECGAPPLQPCVNGVYRVAPHDSRMALAEEGERADRMG